MRWGEEVIWVSVDSTTLFWICRLLSRRIQIKYFEGWKIDRRTYLTSQKRWHLQIYLKPQHLTSGDQQHGKKPLLIRGIDLGHRTQFRDIVGRSKSATLLLSGMEPHDVYLSGEQGRQSIPGIGTLMWRQHSLILIT